MNNARFQGFIPFTDIKVIKTNEKEEKWMKNPALLP